MPFSYGERRQNGMVINTTPLILNSNNDPRAMVQMKVTNDMNAVLRLFPLDVMRKVMNDNQDDNREFRVNLYKQSIPTLAKHYPDTC